MQLTHRSKQNKFLLSLYDTNAEDTSRVSSRSSVERSSVHSKMKTTTSCIIRYDNLYSTARQKVWLHSKKELQTLFLWLKIQYRFAHGRVTLASSIVKTETLALLTIKSLVVYKTSAFM